MKFWIERLRHRHVRARLLCDILVIWALLAVASLAVYQTGNAEALNAFASMLPAMLAAYLGLAALTEVSSASRSLTLAFILLSAFGIAVQTLILCFDHADPLVQAKELTQLRVILLLSAAAIPAGFRLAGMLNRVEKKLLTAFFFFLLVVGCYVILLVFAKESNGTRAWINLWGMQLQLTEVTRFFSAISVGLAVSSRGDLLRKPLLLGLILVTNAVASVAIRELGTLLVVVVSVFVAMFMYNRDLGPVLKAAAFALLAAIALVVICYLSAADENGGIPFFTHMYVNKIYPRYMLLFHIEECDPLGEAYQILRARKCLVLANAFGMSAEAAVIKVPISSSDMLVTRLSTYFGVVPTILIIAMPMLLIAIACTLQVHHRARIAPIATTMGVCAVAQTLLAVASGSGYFLLIGLGPALMSEGGTAMIAMSAAYAVILYATSGFCFTEDEIP